MEVGTQPVEFFLDKAKVKADIVRHKNSVPGNFLYFVGHLIEGRRFSHHLIVDTGKFTDKPRNGVAGIEQCVEGINHRPAIVADNSNFSKPGWSLNAPGCFDVNYAIHALKIRHYRDACNGRTTMSRKGLRAVMPCLINPSV